MTISPKLIAALDQDAAESRDTGIALMAALLDLHRTKGRASRDTATVLYDSVIAPVQHETDRIVLAIRTTLEAHPAALAAVTSAISALPRPDVTA